MNLHEIYPLLILGGIIGAFSIIFIVAYATMKNKKEAIGFDRHMKDSEIIVRLLRYAKPYLPQFLLVGFRSMPCLPRCSRCRYIWGRNT